MKKIALLLASTLLLSFLALESRPALAHTETCQNGICIVTGWVDEPPLVNQLNGVVMEVTRESDGQPINNALAQMDINIRKGTPTKSLSFQPQEEPGVYAATILPTQTGQYVVTMSGTIAGQAIDAQVEIEDVGDTAVLAFPPSTGGNGLSGDVLDELRGVISGLTEQADQANIAAEQAQSAAADATEAAAELKLAADRAYLFGIIGVGVGVAGIAIGVVALSRIREPKVRA